MKIKICGLSRPADIEAVNRYQPDYAGFILNFPKSFRNITPEQAKQLHSMLSDSIPAVGVTVNQPPETAAFLSIQTGCKGGQAHERIPA